jgi:glyoxylase-like metal-dependent hydrolase (beta-lactamase superfamily II)
VVAEGDLIGSLRVIASPGHTPGQIALFDARNRGLIVGDAYSSLFGLSVAGHLNLLFPFPTLATWDAKIAFASAEKLIQFEPALLAPGHGPVLPNPVVLMKAALRRALKVTGSSAKIVAGKHQLAKPAVNRERWRMLIKLSTDKSISEVASAVPVSAQANRFGVMQVHNLKETMAKKGVEFTRECLIFEVC